MLNVVGTTKAGRGKESSSLTGFRGTRGLQTSDVYNYERIDVYHFKLLNLGSFVMAVLENEHSVLRTIALFCNLCDFFSQNYWIRSWRRDKNSYLAIIYTSIEQLQK